MSVIDNFERSCKIIITQICLINGYGFVQKRGRSKSVPVLFEQIQYLGCYCDEKIEMFLFSVPV